MGDSAPLDIVQSEREIAIIAEVQSSARHVYMDGRGHPDMEIYDPTTNGHSIGRWEGQTLVIETVGFNDRGNAFIPGGGVRGPQTKLVERVDLLEERQAAAIHVHLGRSADLREAAHVHLHVSQVAAGDVRDGVLLRRGRCESRQDGGRAAAA